MTGPERRQTPRTTLDKHAYINIEPNNGGIVLNVSDGGLCFHSFDPVPRNGKVRFWFSDNGHRIEGDGALAWTDETQKGGLRFAALPAEAQEKIRDWMNHPAILPAGGNGAASIGSGAYVLPASGSAHPNTKVAIAGSVPGALVSPELKVRIALSGFSRGLATGLLVSAVVVAGVLFHSYRREFGESLIQLGERFAAKPEAQALTVAASPPEVLPAREVVTRQPPALPASPRATPPATQAAREKASTAPAPISVPPPKNVPAQPEGVDREAPANAAKPQQGKMVSAAEIASTPAATYEVAAKSSVTSAAPVPATAIRSPGPTMSSAIPPAIPSAITSPIAAPVTVPQPAAKTASAAASAPSLNPGNSSRTPKLDFAKQPAIQTEGSGSENADASRELYFEVGKFKNVFQAHDESDKLAQLGFPVTAVQKGHLWTSSFHVLVGPYGDEEQAKATHQSLVTDGFKPRPFEKGWRTFTLISSVTLNGARAPEGDYVISWESYIGDADVKFSHNNSVVATAGGRWVKREAKYNRDAYVYRRNADGSRTLLEIHFAGMRQALVFGKPS